MNYDVDVRIRNHRGIRHEIVTVDASGGDAAARSALLRFVGIGGAAVVGIHPSEVTPATDLPSHTHTASLPPHSMPEPVAPIRKRGRPRKDG